MSHSSPNLIEITIESLGGLGDGIAHYNGKPLYIAKSCAGDRLSIRITHEAQAALQGTIAQVISPGPSRQEAPCPYFDQCGGCTLQQLTPDHYRNFKTNIFHSNLSYAGFPTPEAEIIFLPPASRRRVEFKIHHAGGKVRLAFHALRSHTTIVVDECLVINPELQAMIAPLNAALSDLSFASHLYAASLTIADSGMDMVLTVKGIDIKTLPPLDDICRKLGLARISVRTPDCRPEVAADIAPVEMQLGKYRVALPPEAFLQATQQGQALLTAICTEATKSAAHVIDLFSGIGTYSFPISMFAKTFAVEGDTTMVQTIRKSIKRHSLSTLSVEQRDLFKDPVTSTELSRYQAAIINPPRIGAKAQTEQLAASTVSTVVMVSCNPATFSRDAKILKNAGFALQSVQGIDQFLWSPHLEIAAVFKR